MPIEHPTVKNDAAKLSLTFNLVSSLVKIVGAVLTGSLGLMSEAIHSTTDVLSSFMAMWGVKAAAVPPDEDHPYGHGKIESLAGFGESILLIAVAVYLVVEGISRLIHGSRVEQLPLGMAIMALSTVGAFMVGSKVKKAAKETHSLALLSNSQHLYVDAVTSAAVLVSFVIAEVFNFPMIDSIFALLLSAWMIWGAFRLFMVAYHELIDVALPESEVQEILGIINAAPGVISYHRLRTRRSGSVRHVDLHIVVDRDWSVVQAHDAADNLEKTIAHRLPPAHVVVHVDPFDPVRDGALPESTSGNTPVF